MGSGAGIGQRFRLRRWSPFAFLLPMGLVYAAFMLYPIASTGAISLFQWNGLTPLEDFVGLANYSTILADPIFRTALVNTGVWAALSLSLPVAIGLVLAVALTQGFPGSGLFKALLLLPFLFSLTSIGVMWGWLYHPQLGLVNGVLRSLGLDAWAMPWLGDAGTSLLAAVVASSWQVSGFCMLIFYAGLKQIPDELYGAARVDGANRFATFRWITLPLLRPAFVVVLIWVAAHSLKNFDIVWTMTGGGPGYASQVLATVMYQNTFTFFKVGYGAAIAVVILLLVMVFTIPYVRRMEQREVG